MLNQVETEDMVIDLVRILVETAKSIDLVVATIGDGGIDQACGTLAESAGDFGPVSVHPSPLHGRAGHDVGVVRGARGGGIGGAMVRHHGTRGARCGGSISTTKDGVPWGGRRRHHDVVRYEDESGAGEDDGETCL